MQRAKTVTGLLLQYLRTRWAGLGRGGKIFLFGGLVLAAVAAYQVGGCLLGGCPASRQSPCQMSDRSDEPCPYAARRAAAAAEAEAADDDAPPCH